MKTEMFSSLKAIHGVAARTVLSIAVSVAVATSFAVAPVDAFAKHVPVKSSQKVAKVAGSPAAPQPAKVSKVAGRGARSARSMKAQQLAAADDGAPVAAVSR